MVKFFCSLVVIILLLCGDIYAQRPGRDNMGDRNNGSRKPPQGQQSNRNPSPAPVYTPPPATEYPASTYTPPSEECTPCRPIYPPLRLDAPSCRPDEPATEYPVREILSKSDELKLTGINYMDEGEYYKAMVAFCNALAENPGDYDLILLRASANVKLANYLWAISDLDKYIKQFPRDSDAYFYRGVAKYYYADKNDAYKDLESSSKMGNNKAKIFLKRFYIL